VPRAGRGAQGCQQPLSRYQSPAARTLSEEHQRPAESVFGEGRKTATLDAPLLLPVPSQRGPPAPRILAYNLGNLLRRLALPFAIQSWSLTSLQQRLFKTGGRLIRHARYFTLQLAESHLTRPLFRQIVALIERLGLAPHVSEESHRERGADEPQGAKQRSCLCTGRSN
jgi:Transposase DDE domain group 1